jgi:dTDP-4-dehydrorhamnose reductase
LFTTLAGELALLRALGPAVVLRTSWVWSLAAKSFVSTILRLARECETLRVVSDQVGSPTHCRELAAATALLLRSMASDPQGSLLRARGAD